MSDIDRVKPDSGQLIIIVEVESLQLAGNGGDIGGRLGTNNARRARTALFQLWRWCKGSVLMDRPQPGKLTCEMP